MNSSADSISGDDRFHMPVMPDEVMHFLRPSRGETAIDVTLGGGGHAALVVEALGSNGTFIGIDRDKDAIAFAQQRLANAPCSFKLVHGRMGEIGRIAAELGIKGVDCILADLGVSSFQFDRGERGFSIRNDGPLDMRMDASRGIGARELIAGSDADELERIFREYGEERYSRRIARMVAGRDIETTAQLAQEVERAVPRGRQRIHPATRVFQALRIAVNDELGELAALLADAPAMLNEGGRLVVISYHSLEDRMVKRAFRALAVEARFELPKRKAVKPSDEEVDLNPRSRSAKLRTLVRSADREEIA